MTKKYLPASAAILIFLLLSTVVSGQKYQSVKSSFSGSSTTFQNPLLSDAYQSCRSENLDTAKFEAQINTNQRILFCEALQEISLGLNSNWSPALKSELQQIWQVFIRENVKIRLMRKDVSANVRAMAESFTENTSGREFNASLYLRPERVRDKSFFPIVIHELRHIFDFYMLWKSKTSITEAELEKRAFRIIGKINQELPANQRFSKVPTFWDDDWKRLTPGEIYSKREEKIEKFMRRSNGYKHLLTNPQKYLVGYTSNSTVMEEESNPNDRSKGEKLPQRLKIRQTGDELPQQVKEISFRTEKPKNPKNPDELLRAALLNEKNLYYKMDNFVYDQKLQLQCWKKQKVTENYELDRSIARTLDGDTLFDRAINSSASTGSALLPSCILDIETIKSDATNTFWAAPYLDQMRVSFNYFTVIDGIPVARFTVYQPTIEKFNQIAAGYPKIKTFRTFVGTIFVSVEDAQIIKFWGTSFPVSKATGYSPRIYGSYSATAVRQKLASGIWVTTLLNTVAVTDEKNEMKPFSYIVKYQNYRQATTDVQISDDEEEVGSK